MMDIGKNLGKDDLDWKIYYSFATVPHRRLLKINWTFFCVNIVKPKKIFTTFPSAKVLISSSPRVAIFFCQNILQEYIFFFALIKKFMYFFDENHPIKYHHFPFKYFLISVS